MSQINPKISFIIPIYNTAPYLVQCLDSVLAQQIDKEIILIDDGSTDNSLSIAMDYVHRHACITLIHSQNAGLSAARNKGIRLAKGDYLYFVDSDDYLIGDHLSDAYALATQHQIDVLKMQPELFLHENPTEIVHYPMVAKNRTGKWAELFTGYQFFIAHSHSRWIPGVCWSLIKRAFLLKHQHFFVEGLTAEDQIFWSQLLTIDKEIRVLEIPLITYRYRHRANSITQTQNSIAFIQDLYQVIQILQAWQNTHAFPHRVNNGFLNVINHLEYAIEQRFAELPSELQSMYSFANNGD